MLIYFGGFTWSRSKHKREKYSVFFEDFLLKSFYWLLELPNTFLYINKNLLLVSLTSAVNLSLILPVPDLPRSSNLHHRVSQKKRHIFTKFPRNYSELIHLTSTYGMCLKRIRGSGTCPASHRVPGFFLTRSPTRRKQLIPWVEASIPRKRTADMGRGKMPYKLTIR